MAARIYALACTTQNAPGYYSGQDMEPRIIRSDEYRLHGASRMSSLDGYVVIWTIATVGIGNAIWQHCSVTFVIPNLSLVALASVY